MAAGGYLTYLLLLMYAGHLYPVIIPDEYLHLQRF
jgi:hypothetical protein